MTDQKSIRLRLPSGLHSRLVARAEEEEVSLNALMVSMLSDALGESQAYRCNKLRKAIAEAGLEEKLGDAARRWDGRDLRLYKIRGGASATPSVAWRQMRERAEREPWGVVIGSLSYLLEKSEGARLEGALEQNGISYIRDRGRGRPPGGMR